MSSSVTNLLHGYFSVELDGAHPILRSNLINGRPGVLERILGEFRDFVSSRPMTHEEFYKNTGAWFDNDEKLYAAVEEATSKG